MIDNVTTELAKNDFSGAALPLFVLAILIEFGLSRYQQRNLYVAKDFAVSMVMLVLSAIVDFLPKIAAFVLFTYLHEVSPLNDVVGRQWWAWILLFFLDDFLYYWFHRANHEVRIFWAGHVPHHSSTQLNFGTALRQGVGERVHKYLFWIPLPLLGFDAVMIFIMIGLNLLYQFWVHTELVRRLPLGLEWLLNTPSHHRVHHGSNVRYLDRNHGGVLIVWDRLFGTFAEELDDEPVVYGLTESLKTYQPVTVAFGEYWHLFKDVRRADALSDKLAYVLLAPGWSHDGQDKRSNTLRESMSG